MDNGGPAFPSANNVRCGDIITPGHSGMTLRDCYAGMALQGVISDTDIDWEPEQYAKWCYEVADAMLEARKPKKEPTLDHIAGAQE